MSDTLRLRLAVNVKLPELEGRVAERVGEEALGLARHAQSAAMDDVVQRMRERYGLDVEVRGQPAGWVCEQEGCVFNMKDALFSTQVDADYEVKE